ncbi:MAG: hypothetical protein NTW21_17015 [Verrucomicrobia bacterium]|nr:hypothetical protein [Verrucomicrobiota bacterium]
MKLSHLCLGFLILAASACKQNRKIEVYEVPKVVAPGPQAAPAGDPHAGLPGMTPGATMPGGTSGDPHAGLSADQLAAVGASSSPQVTDTPPAHWKKQPATSMRQASYLVTGDGGATTDISLIILRGAAGGTLDNVNRWRGQLGQAPLDEAALKQSSQTLSTPVGEAVAVEIEGLAPGNDAAKDGRMVGVIANKGGDAWFYKMRGNATLTAAEKDNFMKWVLTVKPATVPNATAPNTTPPNTTAPNVTTPNVTTPNATVPNVTTPNTTPPTAISPAAPAVPPPAAAGDGSLTWQVPAGWTLNPAASAMRYATFSIAAADGTKGELAVTHFQGEVGGDLENVNRWRQQVALPPVDQAGLAPLVSKLSAGPKSLSLIDVTGAQARLVAGWTRHGADTWFFKFTGPEALVGAEKSKFTAFLESVRFTKPE